MSAIQFIVALIVTAAALSLIMSLAWAVEQRTGNAGWIDTVWTFGLGAVGAAGALLPFAGEASISPRQWLIAALVLMWSLRLGTHIARRSAGKADDPRYARLRQEWGARARWQMWLLVQKQAIVSVPLALSMLLAAHNPTPGLRIQDLAAVLILLVAVAGEAVADRQLRAFRRMPSKTSGICDIGLWRWSRHPNYFLEWFGWVAYAVIAIDLTGAYPVGWLALIGPVCMYWLLVHVSGIPPLEAHMLMTRGDAFRAYQARTSAFFPMPPAANPREEERMSFAETLGRVGERVAWPDPVVRAGVGWLVGRTRQKLLRADTSVEREFARAMADYPIATHTDDAKAQHYEVPADFFALMLGPQRKYSCCYYAEPGDSLAQAEEHALQATATHAALADGQRILELGCGWGSLSLWMARHYPAARIVSVSNSQSQRAHIERTAAAEGLRNLTVITADMNSFTPAGLFDRVVSVEMFEHMSNWRPLLQRVASWLTPEGLLFLHVFSHRKAPYRFDVNDKADWIAQHFFTGGIMPSHGLIRQFDDIVALEDEWWWDGYHYQRTAEHWLANFDRHADAIGEVLRSTYGRDAALWARRWRLFLFATSGLFGHRGGREWGVSHYRLRPVR